jgi:hypothetical protein
MVRTPGSDIPEIDIWKSDIEMIELRGVVNDRVDSLNADERMNANQMECLIPEIGLLIVKQGSRMTR